MKRTFAVLSAVALAALGTTFAACSSDDNGTGSADSGVSNDTGSGPSGEDSGVVDSSTGPGADANKGPGADGGDATVNAADASDAHSAADSNEAADTNAPVDSGEAVDSSDANAAADANDGAVAEDSGDNADASDAGCVTLTVDNVKVWCSISVNGATASGGASQSVCVAPGTVVSLVAAPNPPGTFKLGPWHNTAGDLDAGGEPGDPPGTTSVTVNGTQCVWICCPFASGGGCIPDPNPDCAYPGH